MNSKFDSPWKLIIERFFVPFMEFFFPEIAREIDWTQKHDFLDKELLAIQTETEVGNKIADKLIKVYKTTGEEVWVIIHIEIQGKSELKFSERMFQYYYKIYDKYKMPIMSAAILTDTSKKWRPDCHQRRVWGCDMTLTYPIIKLVDYEFDFLDKCINLIAKVVQAHLIALQTRGKPGLRLREKLFLVKKLYSLGYTADYMTSLYTFIDYAMNLPAELGKEFALNIKYFEEEVNMRYVTSVERYAKKEGILIGVEKGIPKGQRRTLQILIEKKFGQLTSKTHELLENATSAELEGLTINILLAKTVEELFEKSLSEATAI